MITKQAVVKTYGISDACHINCECGSKVMMPFGWSDVPTQQCYAQCACGIIYDKIGHVVSRRQQPLE